MVKIAVLGSNEFIVGFQLAGIKDTIEAGKDVMGDLESLKKRKETGVVVVEEKILEALDRHQRLEIEDSVDPVFIPVSTSVEQGNLRRLIKKSIGVDLWK
ncbi:V-type ATP synthase subunit F [Candidatus Woesearchaeota archaeon]|nr:V-type ATP synthase subunit F [Candidatus Woesearchaeota archaeon]